MTATILNKDLQDKLSGLNIKKNKDYIFDEYDLEHFNNYIIFKLKANFDWEHYIYRDKRRRKPNCYISFKVPLTDKKGRLIKNNENLLNIEDEYISFNIDKEHKESNKEYIEIPKKLIKSIKKSNWNYRKDKETTSNPSCRYITLHISEDNIRVITSDHISLIDKKYPFKSDKNLSTALKYQIFELLYKEDSDIKISDGFIETKNYIIEYINPTHRIFTDEILDQIQPGKIPLRYILSYNDIKDITNQFIDFKFEDKFIRLNTEILQKILKEYKTLYFEFSGDAFQDSRYIRSVKLYNKKDTEILIMVADQRHKDVITFNLTHTAI